jgi:hypothetical protein
MKYPIVIFVLILVLQWLAAQAGAYLRRRRKGSLDDDERQDFNVILGAAVTLLGLIIGFSFSMAITRYDQRKNLEAEEANAIGTEYVRAGLLPTADSTQTRELLKQYLRQRMLFYVTRDEQLLGEIDAHTSQLQAELWSAVQRPTATQATAVMTLVAAGMNDVLNSQGYTQAAWWNRIPPSAWALMSLFAVSASMLFAYTVRRPLQTRPDIRAVLPTMVAIAFFLIADLDSPRSGIIRVEPHNLTNLLLSLENSIAPGRAQK